MKQTAPNNTIFEKYGINPEDFDFENLKKKQCKILLKLIYNKSFNDLKKSQKKIKKLIKKKKVKNISEFFNLIDSSNKQLEADLTTFLTRCKMAKSIENFYEILNEVESKVISKFTNLPDIDVKSETVKQELNSFTEMLENERNEENSIIEDFQKENLIHTLNKNINTKPDKTQEITIAILNKQIPLSFMLNVNGVPKRHELSMIADDKESDSKTFPTWKTSSVLPTNKLTYTTLDENSIVSIENEFMNPCVWYIQKFLTERAADLSDIRYFDKTTLNFKK